MADPKSPDELPDELLSAYLDDALSSEERIQIEQHLLAHPEAQQQLDQLQAVSSLVRRLPQQPARADFRDSVLNRIERQQSGTEQIVQPKLTIGRSPRGWIWAGLAVAASIALMIYQDRSNFNPPNSDLAHRSMQGPKNPNRDLEWSNSQAKDSSGKEAFDEIKVASSLENRAPARDMEPLAGVSKQEFFMTPSEVDGSANTPTLVVQVVMPATARRNRAFETLLASEGLIDRADMEASRELKTEQHFLIDQGPRNEIGARADNFDKTEHAENRKRRLGRVADENIDFLRGFAGTPEELPAEGQLFSDGGESVEVIMVEAPEANVLSCLEKIQSDERNFLAISVDTLPGQLHSPRATGRTGETGSSQVEEGSSWIGRRQFNRGQIPPRQQALQPAKNRVRLPARSKAGKPQLRGVENLPASEPNVAKAQRKAIARSPSVGDNLIQVVFVLGQTAPPEPVSNQPDSQE